MNTVRPHARRLDVAADGAFRDRLTPVWLFQAGSAQSQTESGDPGANTGLFPTVVSRTVGIVPTYKKLDEVQWRGIMAVSNALYYFR